MASPEGQPDLQVGEGSLREAIPADASDQDAQPSYRESPRLAASEYHRRQEALMPEQLRARTDAKPDPELQQWIKGLRVKLFGHTEDAA
jgi:hypothetical protein